MKYEEKYENYEKYEENYCGLVCVICFGGIHTILCHVCVRDDRNMNRW